MRVNISWQRPFSLETRQSPEKAPKAMEFAPAAQSFSSTLEDYANPRKLQPLRHQQVRRIPPPKDLQCKVARPSLLSGILSRLRGNGAGKKQLQLLETVSLGEKRFVAIINADGRKFLVGGGTSGVALLAQLDKHTNSAEELHSVAGLTELAG